MILPGLACRQVQTVEWVVAGTSSMPSILAPERGFFAQRESLSASGRENRRIDESKFCGIFEQLDHALEQTTGAAAVDASMVEA